MIALILALLMAMCLVPTAVFAEGEQEIDVKGTNLIKITTATDFAAGETTGLVQSGVGNGALALDADATEGTFQRGGLCTRLYQRCMDRLVFLG